MKILLLLPLPLNYKPSKYLLTDPVSTLYTEANEAPVEERSSETIHALLQKTRACMDNTAHHARQKFDRTTI